MARNGVVHKVDEMSPREIRINNIANAFINTYEDKGAAKAALFYYRNIAESADEQHIINRVKELNHHA
jgi:hypothetical protein